MLRCQLCCRPSWAHLPFSRCECSWPHNLHTWLSSNSLQGVSQMFDQLMKRSNWVCVYKMGRFAEERRAFLCDPFPTNHFKRGPSEARQHNRHRNIFEDGLNRYAVGIRSTFSW